MNRAKWVCNSSIQRSGTKTLLVLAAILGTVAWDAAAIAAVTYTYKDPDGTGNQNWNVAADWTPSGPPGSELNPNDALDDIVVIGSRSANGNWQLNLNNINVGTVAQVTLGAGQTTNNTDARPELRVYGGANAILNITGDLILGGVGGSNGTTQFSADVLVGNNDAGVITIGGNIASASTADHDITVNSTVATGLTLTGNIDAGLDPLGAHEIDLTITRGTFTWNGTTAHIEEFNLVEAGNASLIDTSWELKSGQTMIASARGDVGRNSSTAAQTGVSIGTFNLNGAFTANATGANSLVVGSVANDPTAAIADTKGFGTINVGATGALTVTGQLAIADADNDDGGTDGAPGGGTQTVQGTINVNGGTVTVNGGIRFGDATDQANANSFGAINLNSGSMTVKGNVTTGSNKSTITVNGGTLWFDDATVTNRVVTEFNMGNSGTLKLTFAGLTPLTATNSVTFGDTSGIIDLELPSLASNPLVEVLWTGFNSSDWEDTASWDPEVLPSQGAGFLANGQTYTLVESLGSDILNIDSVDLDAGDTLWTIDRSDAKKIQARYTGTTQGFGPATAVIGEYDGSVGSVDRATTLKIGNTVDPLYGPTDAARLVVRESALLDVDADMIIVGNRGTDLPVEADGSTVVNSADVNISDADTIVNVTGNLIFGGGTTLGDPSADPLTHQPGGILRMTNGTLNVSGSIIEGLADGTPDPTVASAQLFIDGPSAVLNVAGDITVQSFRVADAADTTASFTLDAGKNLTNTGTLVVGNRGTGTLVNNGNLTSLNEIMLGNVDQAGAVANASGTLTLNAGSVTIVGDFAPDDGDPNTVEPTTGGGIDVGNADNSTGVLNIVAGSLTVRAGGIESADAANSTTTINIGVGGGNPTITLGELGRGGGGNLNVADQGTGTLNMESGTVTFNTSNFIVADDSTGIGTANISGGTIDLRGVDISRTDPDVVVSNSGDGILNVSGTAKIYVADDLLMSNNNAGAGSQFNLSGGEVYVRDDFQTRANGADIVNITGGKLIYGRSMGTFAGTEQTNELNFQTAGDKFVWTGGTIEGLDTVLGVANLVDPDAAGPIGDDVFYQQGGTLAVTTGTTNIDGAYAVKAGSTIKANLVAGTEIGSLNPRAAIVAPSLVIDPTAEGDVNVELTVVSAGNVDDINAVTFDNGAGTATWDANAANWTNNVLPSDVMLTVAADTTWTLADTGAAITGGTGGNTPLDSVSVNSGFTASLADGAATNSDLVIKLNNSVQVDAAVQAVIDGSVSTPVARTSDLWIDAGYNPEGAAIDAAALRIKNGATLNVTGITSPSLILGGLGGGVVYQDNGTVNIDGSLLFDGTNSVYNLTSGALNVTGEVGDNPDSTAVAGSRFNFDGGTLNKYTDATTDTWAFDVFGIAAGVGSSFDFVLKDGDAITGNLTAATPGTNALYVGEFGTGSLTVGDDDGDPLDGATVVIDGGAEDLFIGAQPGSSGVVTVNSGSTVTVADDIFIGQSVADDGAAGTPGTGGGTGELIVRAGGTVTNAAAGNSGNADFRVGAGTVTVDGGTLTVARDFQTSDGPNDVSTVNFNSGTIDIGRNTYLGDDGGNTGTAAPSTGVATVNIGVGGGAPSVTVGALNIGQWSPATVTMDSGTLTVDNGAFTLLGRGKDALGAGVGSTFTQNGGDVNVTAGEFNIAGRGTDVTGNTAGSSYIMNDGTLTVGDGVTARSTIVGDTANGIGTLTINKGNATFKGELRIADESGGKGTVIVGQGGNAPTVVAGMDTTNTLVADGGEGVFELYSGTWFQNAGNFVLGNTVDSKATVTIDGGTLDTTGQAGTHTGALNINYGTAFYIGKQSRLDILSGTVRLGGALSLTQQTGSESIVNIGDGTKAPTVLVGINLDRTGGTPNTDGINYRGNPGGLGGDTINFKSGTLDLNGGDIDPGTATGLNAFNWTGGTLQRVRQFEGNLAQNSTTAASKLVIGSSPGAMTVTGDYSISGAQSSIEFEIAGTAGAGVAGGHDKLTVNGTATLGGKAEILADPYAGPATRGTVETFALLGATTLSGTFASATFDDVAISTNFTFLTGTNGQFARMKYTTTEADVQAYFAQQGDLNGDLAVNNSDFGIFAANFNPAVGGKRWNQGDLNGDGFVNNSDFGIFAANFGWMYAGPLELDGGAGGGGEVALGSGLTAVPEPNTMALLAVLGLAGAVALRRRRKSRS